MTPLYQAFLEAFNASHLVILYTLAGYLFAGPTSLRLWLATQKTPTHLAVKDEPVTWRKKVLTIGFLLAFLAAEYALFFRSSPQAINTGLTAVFGIMFFGGNVSFFSNLSGLLQLSMHRNAQGVPIIKHVRQKFNKKQKVGLLGILIASLAVTIGAFATNDQTLIAVASAAVIYNMSRMTGLKSISMRWMIIALTGLTAGSMLIGAAITFAFISRGLSSSASDSTAFTWTYGTVVDAWINENSWVFPPLYAYLPGWLVCLCLRFDYQRHLDSIDGPSEVILSTVPAPEPRKGRQQRLGEGVVVPSRAPSAFSKVYFATVLVAWGLTQFGVVCLEAFTSLSLASAYEFGAFALILELPVMCVAVLAVAAVRGESKALWRYREVWAIKPETKGAEASEVALLIPGEDKEAPHV